MSSFILAADEAPENSESSVPLEKNRQPLLVLSDVDFIRFGIPMKALGTPLASMGTPRVFRNWTRPLRKPLLARELWGQARAGGGAALFRNEALFFKAVCVL